jgi:hypothetical protein
MNKYLFIISLGAATAFTPAYAQEAPQTTRTQSTSVLSNTQRAAETKQSIDKSALPPEVMDSFAKSEYRDMSIVTVYEVKTATDGSNAYSATSNRATDDRELNSAVYQSEEKIATSTGEAGAETQTPEEIEETGQVASEDPLTGGPIDRGADGEVTADEKALYENNKYDQYTEANSDAYAEIAKEQESQSADAQTQYELQVQGDEQEMTLIYDQQGNLVRADKGAM